MKFAFAVALAGVTSMTVVLTVAVLLAPVARGHFGW